MKQVGSVHGGNCICHSCRPWALDEIRALDRIKAGGSALRALRAAKAARTPIVPVGFDISETTSNPEGW